MAEKQDIVAMMQDPSVIRDGMQLISENWSPRQQWSGTPLTSEPISTTIGLGSLVFKDPYPSEEHIHTMLNAAIGDTGYATPVMNEQGQPISATQPLWHIEFDDLQGREDFVARLSEFKAAQKGTMVNPTQMTAMAAPAMQESLSR